MSNGKKKNLTLAGLLLLLILLIVGYVIYEDKVKNKSKEETPEVEETLEVITVKEEDISKIECKNKYGELSLVKKEEIWVFENDSELPLNQNYINSMASTMSCVRMEKKIQEGVTDWSEYGLATPSIGVRVTTKDGVSKTLSVGDEAPIAGGYYARVNDDNILYLIAETTISDFYHSREGLVQKEEYPRITTQNVLSLEITQKDQEKFKLEYDTTGSRDYSRDFAFPYVITKPYATPVSADSQVLSELFKNYANLSYEKCVDYHAEDLTTYGLDEPDAVVEIKYFEETQTEDSSEDKDSKSTGKERNEYTYKLCIGSKTEEGNYYVKPVDSDSVYTMSATYVTHMLKVTPFVYVNKNFQLVDLMSLNEMEVKVGKEDILLQIERTKENEDDKEEKVIYKINGDEVTKDTFTHIYQMSLALEYAAEIPEGKETNGEVKASFLFKRNSKEAPTVISQLKAYDDTFYVVTVNGETNFLADKRIVDDLLTKIVKLAKGDASTENK